MHMNVFRHSVRKLVIALACLILPLSQAFALPVIPGATGFGIDTPAGRGGKVYKVTNLNESGSGSLAECVQASGPRVCVFEVSGTIRLTSDMTIANPYITIAGQTAPSPGITIRGASFRVGTRDALIQHLRIRVGDEPDGRYYEDRDGLRVMSTDQFVTNVVIDHVSIGWSIDELMSTWGGNVGEVTFRNNIIAEALDDSFHPKGRHGYGPLLGGGDRSRVSMLNNIIAHAVERNPRTAVDLFFANNLVYNWSKRGTEIFNRYGMATKTSLIGNVYKPGLDTGSTMGIVIEPNGNNSDLHMVEDSKVYLEDNRGPGYSASDPWSVATNHAGNWVKASSPPITVPGFRPMDSRDVEEYVLANAGARPADRDSVDERIIRDIANGRGRIIDSQKDVGGWANLPVNRRPLTLPQNPNSDSNGNGYTNLEEWLHAFAASVEGAGTAPRPPTGLTVQ